MEGSACGKRNQVTFRGSSNAGGILVLRIVLLKCNFGTVGRYYNCGSSEIALTCTVCFSCTEIFALGRQSLLTRDSCGSWQNTTR
jgi:hypothetical protein